MIVVGVDRPDCSGGCNVDADEDRIAMGIGDGGAVVVGRVRIVVARHQHAEALALELDAYDARDQEDAFFFDGSVWPARAGVRAAVAWIEDDERTSVDGRWRRGLRRRCLLRGGRLLLRRGLLLRGLRWRRWLRRRTRNQNGSTGCKDGN